MVKIKRSKELRKRISDTLKRKGIKPPSQLGYKHTQEAIEKIRQAGIGRKYTVSEDTKKLIGSSLKTQWKDGKRKGHSFSEESKKKMSEAHKGEKSVFWKGGIAKKPYAVDWTKTLRQSIRERDKYTCRLCMEKQGDRAHAVHHIDYNKLNCDPKNLVTLCAKCHTKTNMNREYWKSMDWGNMTFYG